MVSDLHIEDYRRTLALLNELYEKKCREGADKKQLDTLREEIHEVSETLSHLTKGANRYRWTDL